MPRNKSSAQKVRDCETPSRRQPSPEPPTSPPPPMFQVPVPNYSLLSSENYAFSGDAGESVRDYVRKLETFFAMCAVPKVHRHHAVAFTLRGNARKWFYTLPQSTQDDWPSLSDAIKKEFGRNRQDDLSRFERLHGCRQRAHQSVASYLKDFSSLAYDARLDDQTKLSFFVVGLRDDIRKEVKRQRPENFNEARELAEEFENDGSSSEHATILKKMEELLNRTQSPPAYNPPPEPQHWAVPTQLQAMQHQQQMPKVPVCDFCGKMGHAAANCYKTVVCNFCGKTGHPGMKCRSRPQQQHQAKCGYCACTGHVAETCPQMSGNEPRPL